jgi:endonuclease III related protein
MMAVLANDKNPSDLCAVQSDKQDRGIRDYFTTLYREWGQQHWWPGESPFEVIVGAYLTQNTSWTNVERALGSLRAARLLSVTGVRRVPLHNLETLVRSAGHFRQKARRLKTFVAFLDKRYQGSLARMFAQPTVKLRAELLELNGVGPETADSILLYAGNHPVFVVDAYTRRILERHNLIAPHATYEEIRALFERALAPLASEIAALRGVGPTEITKACSTSHPPSRMSTAKRSAPAQLFNEMHGLIVGVGKQYCKKSQPDCERCPLRTYLPVAK